jgi:hypothetical protein
MEGQVQLKCRDCGRTASVRGEIPVEYTKCFRDVIARDGWVIAPLAQCEILCGACFATYAGHETVDDAEKLASSE